MAMPFPIDSTFFTDAEREELRTGSARLSVLIGDAITEPQRIRVEDYLTRTVTSPSLSRDVYNINPLIADLRTAIIVSEELGMRRSAVIALFVYEAVRAGVAEISEVEKDFDEGVARIVGGLAKVSRLYEKNPSIESENFRNLLLSFADDMRVILIMIAGRVALMRSIGDAALPTGDEASLQHFLTARQATSREAACFYAPLAHKLGLYQLKSELEDLSMKYTETEMYYHIKDKLAETKSSRDAYIAAFIKPIETKMAEAGLRCHIKGRTKSIHSIWQKMKRQHCPFEGVYDLFAIRIILDSVPEREKQECWLAYSLVTDMYQPNPNRLRDWLSIPKSNGYESLHTTVMGPGGRWVEVQIRTERMDDIAERGLAAHWRYKGVQSESGIDAWLTGIREALESADDSAELMDTFKMDLYRDDVFVFTPRGDLHKLPHGATVLDFAFSIHTNLGCHCTGARVGGRHVPLRHVLSNGDQVEILSSDKQTPRPGWLDIVTTSRARSKVRQALKEMAARQSTLGREEIERRFKNRHIELEEGLMLRLIRRMGFKQQEQEFYQQVAEGAMRSEDVIEGYLRLRAEEQGTHVEETGGTPLHSASEFRLEAQQSDTGVSASNGEADAASASVLFVDPGMVGVEYRLAGCCKPVYGDDIFGFVTVSKGITIHRSSCPNATDLRDRYGYRLLPARWAGKHTGRFSPVTLRVVGNDDIGIVNNLTSIIAKDEHMSLRSISIDTHDNLFSGTLTVMMDDTSRLASLLRKLSDVRGVKQVQRI